MHYAYSHKLTKKAAITLSSVYHSCVGSVAEDGDRVITIARSK